MIGARSRAVLLAGAVVGWPGSGRAETLGRGVDARDGKEMRLMVGGEVKSQVHRLRSEHAHERDRAVAWLLEHPDEARPVLIDLVRAATPSAATPGAIDVLGRMGRDEDVPLLADVLMRADPSLTWETAQVLGRHRSPAAVAALLDGLRHDQIEVVGAAAVALGGRGDEVARPPLEALLGHPSEIVRYRAVYALKRLGASSSRERLRAHYATETSDQVRQLIAEVVNLEDRP